MKLLNFELNPDTFWTSKPGCSPCTPQSNRRYSRFSLVFFEPCVLFFFEKFQKISKFFSNLIKIFDILCINLNSFWSILFLPVEYLPISRFAWKGSWILLRRSHFRLASLPKDLSPSPFYWQIANKWFQEILQNVSKTGSVFRKVSKTDPLKPSRAPF